MGITPANKRSYAMRGGVPVLATSHLLTFEVTRQVSALSPALRIPPPLAAIKIYTVKLTISILMLLSSIDMIGANFNIDTLSINSKILSECRTILVFTPTDLKEFDSVSIVYMTDGEFSKYRFEKIVDNNINKTIGIGIINTDRKRDLLPVNQANKFNTFIEKELIPLIEQRHLIHERVLYGHSFGGAFTIYSMINNPALFNKYIASSPTPIMDFIDTDLYKQLDDNLPTNIKLFLSYGSTDMRQVRKWTSRLIENLHDLETNKINWTSQVFKGENHNTSDTISIIKGLRF